jgi:hypothetical protein
MKLLKGHSTPETAFVVEDYPYGFTLRCKIRYWLEENKRGARFVSQTTNPKKAGEVWNKPKASTYCLIAGVMLLDENEHCKWAGLTEYSDLAESEAWYNTYKDGLSDMGKASIELWIEGKRRYEAALKAREAA